MKKDRVQFNFVKVSFLTAEMPFSKAGGLADVSGSLPGALKQQGIDISIFTPFYRVTKETLADTKENVKEFKLKFVKKDIYVKFHETTYQGVPV